MVISEPGAGEIEADLKFARMADGVKGSGVEEARTEDVVEERSWTRSVPGSPDEGGFVILLRAMEKGDPDARGAERTMVMDLPATEKEENPGRSVTVTTSVWTSKEAGRETRRVAGRGISAGGEIPAMVREVWVPAVGSSRVEETTGRVWGETGVERKEEPPAINESSASERTTMMGEDEAREGSRGRRTLVRVNE